MQSGHTATTEQETRTMEFEYFEIRPCIEIETGNGDPKAVESYASEDEYETALDSVQKTGKPFQTFWTIYGRHFDIEGQVTLATAIGDFDSKKSAHEIMNAILAPMAKARNLIEEKGETVLEVKDGFQIKAYQRAAFDLDDFINQSSNEERI